jgi:hypothetical protein
VSLAAQQTLSAADHRRQSLEAAQRADWTTAVIERMRALARELEERSILVARPGRTATELAAEAGAAVPTARVALYAAADTFNAVVYGGRGASAAQVEVVANADDAVRAAARGIVVVT